MFRQSAFFLGLAAVVRINHRQHHCSSLRVFYVDQTLERRTPTSQQHFDTILNQESTRFVPVRNGDSFYTESSKRAVFLSPADVVHLTSSSSTSTSSTDAVVVYLGCRGANDYVAIDIPTDETLLPLPLQQGKGVKGTMLRNFSENLVEDEEAALLAYARGMCVWHRNTQFCSKCGSQTRTNRYGASRKCTNDACKSSSYPRIEPASIQLILDRTLSHALLGRKKEWPKGRYSCLAGFTEIGETLEQTVLRETMEEAGVAVDPSSLTFVASQPWPFPGSLMIGYRGTCMAQGLPPVPFDNVEMDDVRWFSKVEIREALERKGSTALEGWKPDAQEALLHFPGKSSLARVMLTQWAAEQDQ